MCIYKTRSLYVVFTHTNQTVSLCHYTYDISGVRVVPNKNERQLLVLPSYMPSRVIIFSSGLQGLLFFHRKEKTRGVDDHDDTEEEGKTEENLAYTRNIRSCQKRASYKVVVSRRQALPVLSLFIFFLYYIFFYILTNGLVAIERIQAEIVKS